MSTPLICYILIGLPGSGKSTLAAKIQTQDPRYQIISTDRIRADLFGDATIQGDWPTIETEVLQQIQKALSANIPIIYDATNYKRAFRIDLLQKLAHHPNIYWVALHLNTPSETCKNWNQHRSRQVDEQIIDSMAKALKTFPPITEEGFAKVNKIDPLNHTLPLETPKTIARSITNRTNRCKNYDLHAYSRLQDFEQLMHLLALMIAHPGIGNLQQTAPETLKSILGNVSHFATSIAEISALMAKLYSPLYANPHTLQKNLDFLERNGFFDRTKATQTLHLDDPTEEPTTLQLFAHRYADKHAFIRICKTIRWLAHNRVLGQEIILADTAKSSIQDTFFQALCQENIYSNKEQDTFRRDIQEVLKPYGIFPASAMKRGYFIGTNIFSEHELLKLLKVTQSLQTSIKDPLSTLIYDTFKTRIRDSAIIKDENIENIEDHPIRAIAHQTIVDVKKLSEQSAYKKLDELEIAIEKGHLLEIQPIKGSASFSDTPEKDCYRAYPLQLVFHNISWYLGYERILSANHSILEFTRLDRIYIATLPTKPRSAAEQLDAFERLRKLYTSSPSIYLGNSAEEQAKYLSKDLQEKQTVEVEIELWITDRVFSFISEGDNRFPKKQMHMSKPKDKNHRKLDPEIFTLDTSTDSSYPNRFIVRFPKWALDDIDFRRWVVSFGAEIKVIKPSAYVEKIQCFYQNAANLYKD